VGVYSGPEITNDGLVLSLDAANLKGYDKYENLISHSASTSGIVLGAIGSGGSLPTGWVIDQGQPGTTLEVVGYGIEEGLNYIDLKFSGTTSTTNRWLVRPGNAVSLTSGVTYNSSVYAKTISGTPTDFRQFSVFGGGSGASLSGINSTLTRYSGSSAAGSTGTYYPRLDIGYNSIGTVMNFTIRVAGFQAEVGSSVTDYYPTTGTAKTRGSTLIDLSGRGNTGTLTNGVGYNNSNIGSFVFDGVDDYITCGNPSSLNFGTGNFTISFIVYTTAYGFQGGSYVGKGNGTTIGFDFRDGGFFLYGTTGLIAYNSFAATLNVWEHHTIVYDSSSSPYVKFYKNGTYTGGSTTNNAGNISSIDTSEPLRIGLSVAGGPTRYFNGRMPLVQIYNRALTAAEIQQNYNATKSRYGL